MHAYRTHNCGQLRESHVGERIKLSGWVHRKRDHGNLLFVDLRDHYGITQIVTDVSDAAFKVLEALRVESVVTIDGEVVARGPEATNPNLATGAIEVVAETVTIQSEAQELPVIALAVDPARQAGGLADIGAAQGGAGMRAIGGHGESSGLSPRGLSAWPA